MPVGLGASCVDAPCSAGLFCASYADLDVSVSGKICVQGCCSSLQCPMGEKTFVCMPSKLGGGLCAPTGLTFQRKTFVPQNQNDFGEVGKSCKDGEACRSGWCDEGKCNDLCCGDAGCDGQTCKKREVPSASGSLQAFACGSTSGAGYGTAGDCGNQLAPSDADCASNVCAISDVIALKMRCSKPCCSSVDCKGSGLGDDFLDVRDVACSYVKAGGGSVRACAMVTTKVAGGGGKGCIDDLNCKSGVCLPHEDGKYCSDTCCSAADCPSGWGCQPVQVGSTSELRCVKPSPNL